MTTLREIIENILMQEGIQTEKIGPIATRIMAIGRGGVDLTIIHQIGPMGQHRLIINGVTSEWKEGTEIIRIGDFIATTDAYIDLLPQVGKIFQLRDKDIRTEAVQTLSE